MNLFSTSDGWRGLIETEFTSEFLESVIEGFLHLIKKNQMPQNGIVVGYDTRRNSREYAEMVANRLSIEGMPVFLSNIPVPTPIVTSYAIEKNLTAAIIITASHFPGEYNGIKFRFQNGRPPSSTELESIMNFAKTYLHRCSFNTNIDVEKSTIVIINLKEWYIDYLILNYGDLLALLKSPNQNRTIVVDAIHGTISGIFPDLLRNFGWEVVEIRTNEDYNFGGIRPDPIEPNSKLLFETVKKIGATLGVASDGDGERVCFIDPLRGYIGPSEIPPLVLLSVFRNIESTIHKKPISSTIIKTYPVTIRVDQLIKTKNYSLIEVPVGFKSLYFSMVENNATIGFSDDGSVVIPPIFSKDAFFTTLCVLSLLNVSSLNDHLEDFIKKFGQLYYFKDNIPYTERFASADLLNELYQQCGKWKKTRVMINSNNIKFFFSEGWLLIRIAGTEDFIRVYCESNNKKDMTDKVNEIYSIINRYLPGHVGSTRYTKLN